MASEALVVEEPYLNKFRPNGLRDYEWVGLPKHDFVFDMNIEGEYPYENQYTNGHENFNRKDYRSCIRAEQRDENKNQLKKALKFV